MDVKHWIKHIGMAKHKSEFRVLSGEVRQLLCLILSPKSIDLCPTRIKLNLWLQDLLTLQETDVMAMCKQDTDAKYVWRMLLRLKGEPEPSKVAPAVAAKEACAGGSLL